MIVFKLGIYIFYEMEVYLWNGWVYCGGLYGLYYV